MNVNSRIARANFTGFTSGAIASFTGLREAPIKVKSYINSIQTGSGDPAPDNIRPIIGVSECNVVRCGVNNFNETWSAGYVNASGTFVPTGAYSTTDYIPVKQGKSYYVKATVINADRANVAYYDANKTFIKLTSSGMAYNSQFTIDEDCSYIRVILTNTNTTRENFSINYPSTDTDYHAYTGNTYTIQLGDTYYGGVLDVTTGVLTVTREIVDLGALTFYYQAQNCFYVIRNDVKGNGVIISSAYRYTDLSIGSARPDLSISLSTYYGQHAISIKDTRYDYTSITDFRAQLNGIQAVYELATPINIQLTPTQIEQLLGTNNVFADCGNVEVYYVTI